MPHHQANRLINRAAVPPIGHFKRTENSNVGCGKAARVTTWAHEGGRGWPLQEEPHERGQDTRVCRSLPDTPPHSGPQASLVLPAIPFQLRSRLRGSSRHLLCATVGGALGRSTEDKWALASPNTRPAGHRHRQQRFLQVRQDTRGELRGSLDQLPGNTETCPERWGQESTMGGTSRRQAWSPGLGLQA